MHPAPDGLKHKVKGCWNRYFDWREDAVYLPGSIVPMDLFIRYAAYLPDIAIAAGGFSVTAIPIMRSAEALAAYSAGIFVAPRGSMLAASFEAEGDAALDQITSSFAKLQQRASFRRKPWGGYHRQLRRLL